MIDMSTPTQTIVQYRLFQESDMPGVLALWRDHSGWGEISAQQFRNWYLDTPNGACLIAVMEDGSGEILGQMVMIPAQAVLARTPIRVLRVVAPILHQAARSESLLSGQHPTIELFRCLWKEAVQQGYYLAYTFPAYGWQAFMKIFPRFGLPKWDILEFECYGIDLNELPSLDLAANTVNCKVSVVQHIGQAYDQLWQEASEKWGYQYSICRNKNWLQWRQGAHLHLEVRDRIQGILLGYLVIDQRTALLADAFASDEASLKLVLWAGIWALHQQNPEPCTAFSSKVLKVMNTTFLSQALTGLALEKVDYTFTFGCNLFQALPEAMKINWQEWYLMPND